MKKILITGFEPFGDESINSSWEAVLRLADRIGEFDVVRLLLPVSFKDVANTVIKVANEIAPDIILCIGQAGGRCAITPELVAINLRYASIPDNCGYMPKDEQVILGGKEACFSTIPARHIAEAISAAGISSTLSYSAGAYVCNDVFYTLLSHFEGSKTSVGFIHVPYCKEQGKEPNMEIYDIVRGLTVAIENL